MQPMAVANKEPVITLPDSVTVSSKDCSRAITMNGRRLAVSKPSTESPKTDVARLLFRGSRVSSCGLVMMSFHGAFAVNRWLGAQTAGCC